MQQEFVKSFALTRLMCLLILAFGIFLPSYGQTRAVYTFDDKEPIPSYQKLKDQVDRISSKTIDEYREALNVSEAKADEVLATISSTIILISRLSNCAKEARAAGWTDAQLAKMPELMNKSRIIWRRLKRIQDKAFHRALLRRALFFY